MENLSIMSCMESHREIVRAWGRETLAADLNVPKERVRAWERFDSIPAGYWQKLLKRASERNICISADLLISLAARD